MAETQIACSRWIPAALWPSANKQGWCKSVLMLNETEFAVLVGHSQIFKYNVSRDDWSPFLKLPINVDGHDVLSMEIDRGNNRLFMLCVGRRIPAFGTLINELLTVVINLQSGLMIHRIASGEITLQERGNNVMVNANGIIHKMGGAKANHMVWNELDLNWNVVHSDLYWGKPVKCFSLMHVPSKNIVLMFCSETSSSTTSVWRYHIECGDWRKIEGLQIDYRATSGWGFGYNSLQTVLTRDEGYVIFHDPHSKYLSILDIRHEDHYTLRRSSIAVPHDGSWYAMMSTEAVGGRRPQLIVSGWIRRYLKGVSIPLEIMRLISDQISEQMIHWVTRVATSGQYKVYHHKIPLHHVLHGLANCKT